MMWDNFIFYALAASALWIAAALMSALGRGVKALPPALLSLCGSAVFLAFIIGLWTALERPPLRTVGETRLWYSFFVSIAGAAVWLRWKYRWILPFSTLMSVVFVLVNIFKPEIHDKTLVPALQSVWFVPHVTVYMLSYAVLGAATVFALWLWIRPALRRRPSGVPTREQMALCDNLVRIGWAFLTLGMIMGSLWAKQAWGDWWTWDPKETWAAATWLSYLLYLHLRKARPSDHHAAFAIIILSFILLQMCWYGINWLPWTKGASIHIY